MLRAFLFVGIGGFAGSIARYAMSYFISRGTNSAFPWGTFMVNILGCFIIGLLAGWLQRDNPQQDPLWLLLATGFCGGFTTFSSFALEQHNLMDNGQFATAAIYAAVSLLLGLLVCRGGILLTTRF